MTDQSPAALLALAEGAPPATAVEAIGRIRIWHEALKTLAAVAEAQIMEACWTIRREFPDRPQFDAVIDTNLSGVLQPDRGWLMAETWGVARRQRDVRQLVSSQPDAAMRFVREFVDAGTAEQLELLDEDDQTMAELLSATPRQRRLRIRGLLAAERAAAAGRSPADIRRIEELEAAAGVTSMDDHPAARLRERLAQLAEAERVLRETAEATEGLGAAATERQRAQLLAYTDRIIDHAEAIASDIYAAPHGDEAHP